MVDHELYYKRKSIADAEHELDLKQIEYDRDKDYLSNDLLSTQRSGCISPSIILLLKIRHLMVEKKRLDVEIAKLDLQHKQEAQLCYLDKIEKKERETNQSKKERKDQEERELKQQEKLRDELKEWLAKQQ